MVNARRTWTNIRTLNTKVHCSVIPTYRGINHSAQYRSINRYFWNPKFGPNSWDYEIKFDPLLILIGRIFDPLLLTVQEVLGHCSLAFNWIKMSVSKWVSKPTCLLIFFSNFFNDIENRNFQFSKRNIVRENPLAKLVENISGQFQTASPTGVLIKVGCVFQCY